MLFCVEHNCDLENRTMSALTVSCVTLLGMDRVPFVGITVGVCWIRSLLNAQNQTITLTGTVNCTVGHAQYEFRAYCANKSTSSGPRP